MAIFQFPGQPGVSNHPGYFSGKTEKSRMVWHVCQVVLESGCENRERQRQLMFIISVHLVLLLLCYKFLCAMLCCLLKISQSNSKKLCFFVFAVSIVFTNATSASCKTLWRLCRWSYSRASENKCTCVL